ncbi:MAG: hypothetical protein RR315_08080, partial [Oscillospiraceae bacterium]
MKINKVIATLAAISCMTAQLTAFAGVDYDDSDGVIAGFDAPTAAQLRDKMYDAKQKDSKATMKRLSAEDY